MPTGDSSLDLQRPLMGLATLVTLFGLLSAACIDHTNSVKDKPSVTVERRTLARSVQGRPIECIALGDGSDVVLIMATIHGDEDAGTPLVDRLIVHLQERPELLEGRRVILMPNVNPDGMAHQSRYNARGVDLNRNFPADNYNNGGNHGKRPLSEPESAAIHALLDRERPNRIVSIHQPLNYGSACIDYDGPAEPLARAMGEHTDIPVKRIGSRPGSLGSYAGVTLQVPIITLELPKEAKGESGTSLWEKYGRMMLASVVFPEKP